MFRVILKEVLKIEAIIDYLRFTIDTYEWGYNAEDVIRSVLFMDVASFIEKKGQYGYLKRLEWNNISVYFEGQRDMGILVQMSGKGCRFIETYVNNFMWIDFLGRLKRDLRCNIPRIDIAIDEYEGYLEMERLQAYIDGHKLVTKFRQYTPSGNCDVKTNKRLGNTLYFGSRKSSVLCRIYDKRLERLAKGLDCDREYWVRYELELKDDRANRFVDELLHDINTGGVGWLAAKVINNYMRFVEERELNSTRSQIAPWWEEFVSTCEKLKLSNTKAKATMEDLYNWIKNSVAPSLKVIESCYGHYAIDKIITMAVLSDKQKLLVRDFKIQQEKEDAG